MEIGKMHVRVNYQGMVVRVGMGSGVIGFVFMPMMFVVVVPMFVPGCKMLMFVHVVLPKEECCCAKHDYPRHGEPQRQRFSQEKERSSRSDKRRRLKPRGRPGCADVARAVYEEDETRAVTECSEEKSTYDKGRCGQTFSDGICDKEGNEPCDETFDPGDREGVLVG